MLRSLAVPSRPKRLSKTITLESDRSSIQGTLTQADFPDDFPPRSPTSRPILFSSNSRREPCLCRPLVARVVLEGGGLARAFLKLCGFFKSGAPPLPPPATAPTIVRCTLFHARVAIPSSSSILRVRRRRDPLLSVPLGLSVLLASPLFLCTFPPPLPTMTFHAPLSAPPRPLHAAQLFFRRDRLHRLHRLHRRPPRIATFTPPAGFQSFPIQPKFP